MHGATKPVGRRNSELNQVETLSRLDLNQQSGFAPFMGLVTGAQVLVHHWVF